MTTTEAAERAIYALLDGDAPLAVLVGTQIYPDVIPQSGSHPAVVYTHLSGIHDLRQGRRFDGAEMRYLVKACAEAPKEASAAIDAAVDAVLHGASVVVEGVFTVEARRVESFSLTTIESSGSGSKHFCQLGGVYRLHVRPI